MDGRHEPLIDEGLELLEDSECRDLLPTVPIGRVAVTINGLPAVFPVNFAVYNDRIVFRTNAGTKLDAAVRNAVVAFEVDQFDATERGGWSVLVVGRAEDITDNLGLIEGDGQVTPWASGAREHYVSIKTEFVSGRRITRDTFPDV